MKLNMKVITEGAKVVTKFAAKHSPTICVIFGTALMAGAVVKTIVEAPKAKEELDDLDETVHYEDNIPVKKYIREKTTIIARHYWPTAAMTFGGAAMIFWGHKVSLGRTAAALAAYQMSKDDLKRLENKIVEMDGEKHLEKVKDEINKDKALSTAFNNDLVINTGHGTHLFYDPIGRDYFLSDFEFIRQAQEDANVDLAESAKTDKYGRRTKNSVMTYDQWREYLGLPPIDGTADGIRVAKAGAFGNDLGWFNRKVRIKFTSMLLSNGEHCEVMGYTDYGGPDWYFNLSDEYNSDYDGDDDSTDMRDRGR